MAVALILALFSAALGAVDGLSALSNEDWFTGDINPDMPNTDWESVANDLSQEETTGVFDDVLSYINVAWLLVKTLLSALKGVLFIGSIINDLFYYEIGGQNMVPIISSVINVGVWIIYVIGLYQLKHGDSIRHYW